MAGANISVGKAKPEGCDMETPQTLITVDASEETILFSLVPLTSVEKVSMEAFSFNQEGYCVRACII
tara:strand:- start:78 stop:278 length:201 start_codon:yes stop_codon:yes gene_type:complete